MWTEQTAWIRLIVMFSLLVVLGLWSCAKMGLPPGGPEDKSGPSLLSHYPETDATNVPRRMTARLEFSEPVNRSSVEAGLFLSPDPMQRLRYRWHGRMLELVYLDELEENRTYVISVGNQAKDLRGNPSGETLTIAFSTGEHIDRGRIDGWVTDVDAPQAVSVWARALRADSALDLMSERPDYRIQPDETGRFHLSYMHPGIYRVFAVLDRDHDGLWNPSAETIGLPPWDVTVTDTTVSWVSFKLAAQDTAPPALRSVKEIHQFEIQVRTTVPVRTLDAFFSSQQGDTDRTLDKYPDKVEADIWHVFPDQKLAAGHWTVRVSGESQFGEAWADAETLEVRDRADTTRPLILTSDPPIKGRARNILPKLTLEFAEPVVLDSGAFSDALLISPAKDTSRVTVEHDRPRIIEVLPAAAFVPGNFLLRLNGALIHDLSGNSYSDTTTELRFGFYSGDSLGALQVTLSAPPGQYILTLLAAKGRIPVDSVAGLVPKVFSMASLPAGKYTMEIVRDINFDSRYTFGRMQPWQYSEPYFVPQDTITIRARWEQDISVSWPENP